MLSLLNNFVSDVAKNTFVMTAFFGRFVFMFLLQVLFQVCQDSFPPGRRMITRFVRV